MKLTFFFCAVVCCLSGCGRTTTPQPVSTIDLVDRFTTGEKAPAAPGTSGSFERHASVTRGGRAEDAMTLIAPIMMRADLGGISGRYALQFVAAPVFNIGDGMQMDVYLGTAGERKRVFGRYFDAGRKASDRKWTRWETPVDIKGIQGEYLEIQVSGGPQGDLVTDWLALAEIVLQKTKNKP